MKYFLQNLKHNSNKGLSLVEVICSVAILSMVCILVCAAMRTGMLSYNRGIQETDLQKDAQLFANQVTDLIIDSTDDVTFDASTQTLTILQSNSIGNVVKHTISLDSDGKVWYKDANGIETPQLLAEGVRKMDFDVTDFKKNGNVIVSLELFSSDRTREYKANYTVTCRNGHGDGSPTPISVFINVDPEIVIEPGQELQINASVVGSSCGLRYTIVEGCDSTITSIGYTDGIVSCDKNQRDGFVVRITTEETEGGVPKAEKYVFMKVRRVTDIEINPLLIECPSGNNKVGATYNLGVTVNGTNLTKVFTSVYDNDYVSPYQIGWDVNIPSACTLVTDPGDSRLSVLKLTRDLLPGEKLIVTAKSLHASGDKNKSSSPYQSGVIDQFIIYPPIPWGDSYDYPDGILRGDQREQIRLNMDFLNQLKNELGGSVNWKFWFKYKKIGGDGYDSGWILNTDGSGADGNDSAAYKLRPEVLYAMDRRYGYHFWMKIVVYDNETNEQLYPPKNEPEEPYIIEGDMAKFGIKFSSDLLGFYDTTYNADRVTKISIGRDEEKTLFSYTGVRGWYVDDSEGMEFARNLTYTAQKKVDGVWKDIDINIRHDGSASAGCVLRGDNRLSDGEYRVLCSFSKIRHNTLSDGIPTEGWDYNVPLYDETYTDGVIYFNVNYNN